MKKQKYKELRKELVKALDSLLEEQAKKLEKAIQGQLYTGDKYGDAELLVKAGLVRCVGDYGSLFHSEYVYEATSKGHEVYKRIKR